MFDCTFFKDTAEKLSSGTFGTDKSVRPIHTYQYTTDVDVPFQITATIYDTGRTFFCVCHSKILP